MNKLFEVDRISENSRSNIIWRKEQIDYIIVSYKNGTSIKKLSNQFSVHPNSIKKILQDNNLYIRNLQQSLANKKINHNIFDNIDTEEKAYWLGFLAADGNVYNTRITCTLQSNDKNHLKKLNDFLEGSLTLSEKIVIKNEKTFKYNTLTFYSSKISNNLIKYGVTEQKSLTLKPPLFLNDYKLQIAWIRGYFDGDGGISLQFTPNRRAQFYCTGTIEVLNWICEIMQLKCTPFLEHNCKDTYRIHQNGWQICFEKMSLLYENANIYLDRKYRLFLSLNKPTDLEIRKQIFKKQAFEWAKNNKDLVLNCKKNNIITPLQELFELGKKYGFTDRRSISTAICGDKKTKTMLEYLQSTLQP